jgi:hypothetical protein
MLIKTSDYDSVSIAKAYIDNQEIAGISVNLTLVEDINDFNNCTKKNANKIIKYLRLKKSYECSFKTEYDWGYTGGFKNIFIKCHYSNSNGHA